MEMRPKFDKEIDTWEEEKEEITPVQEKKMEKTIQKVAFSASSFQRGLGIYLLLNPT